MNEAEILRRILQYITFYIPRDILIYTKLANMIVRDLLTSHNLRICTQQMATWFFMLLQLDVNPSIQERVMS